jgi:hypothetical protein
VILAQKTSILEIAFGPDLRFAVEAPVATAWRTLLEECFSTFVGQTADSSHPGGALPPLIVSLEAPPGAGSEQRQALLFNAPATVWRQGQALGFEVGGAVAWCHPEACRGGIQINNLEEKNLEDFISFAFAPMLLELAQVRGWFAVHAAALASKGRGILLPGPSGCGKTTIFRGASAGGLEVLSDDLVWLRRHGEKLTLQALPRWLERQGLPAPTADSVPLHAIVLPTIVPQPENRLQPITVQECLDTLLAASGTLSECLWQERLGVLLSSALSARLYRLEAGHRRNEVPSLLAALGEEA